jgi:regulator of replication initiation timing
MNNSLVKSKVVFNPENHTYSYEGKQLSGVTSLLSATLFKDKYSGIDEEVLRKAAAYGTSVHETIELFETMGFDDVGNELTNYKKICKEHGIRAIESEYLVSDNSRIASSIDLVMENAAREVVLVDIKTTSGGIDRDYLSWQLSIYAYLFELQTGILVEELACVWLRHEESEYMTIPRRSNGDVMQLLDEYFSGCEVTVEKQNLPMEVKNIANAISEVEKHLKDLTAQRDILKEKILNLMKANQCEKVEIDGKVLITYVAPTTKESLDTKKFKDEHPELYEKYVRQSDVKESLRITIKKF